MEVKRVEKRKASEIMPRATIVFITVLTVLAGLLGYNYFAKPFTGLSELELEESIAELNTQPQPEESEFSAQDLTQLIAFPFLIEKTVDSSQSAQPLSWIEENNPGGVTLFGESVATTSAKNIIEQIKNDSMAGDQPLIMVDHEGGEVQRLNGKGFTVLPSWQSLCAMGANQRKELLNSSATELSEVGIDVVLAPMLDMASQSAVLKNRVCSSDPGIINQRAVEWIEVFSQHNIFPVVKHFPGIGSLDQDPHFNYTEVTPNEEELLIFREVLGAYPNLGVMTSHVGIKDFYEDQPCSLNGDCVDDLSEFFPEALIFSDALEMVAAGYQQDEKELLPLADRAVLAINAGNNILVFGPTVTSTELDDVLGALNSAYELDVQFREKAHLSLEKIKQLKINLKQ